MTTMLDRVFGRRPQGGRNVPQVSGEEAPDLFELQSNFHRMVDDVFRRAWEAPLEAFRAAAPLEATQRFNPKVDVWEDDDHVMLQAELPGLSKDDLEIRLNRDHLVLQGEKKSEREREREGWYQMERSWGWFQRMIPLPAEVDRNKVDASFKEGVLHVKLAKTDAAKRDTKKIEVRAG